LLPRVSESQETSLVIEPEAVRWGEMLRARELSAPAIEMRRDLGLPTDRPVIMAGHQAVFWHPGILAKYLAADAPAKRLGASAAWVVVDHDTDDPWMVRYPARDAAGRLTARMFDLRGTGARREDGEIAVCRRPAMVPTREVPSDVASLEVRDGLTRIRDALASHAEEPNAARQVTKAVGELTAPLVSGAVPVFSSELSRTAMFGRLMAAMDRDPRACVLAYNAAITHAPGAGLRPLFFDEVNERYELPLWRIDQRGARHRVYAEDLEGTARHELAPRALMMTALLRLGACDLFIHGTGGGLYEKANDAWIGAWPDPAAGAPATVAVVTATRRLSLLNTPAPTARDVARATWTAHHARHDPAMLGDHDGAARRRELVVAIKSARHQGREPRQAFERLHEFLRERRAAMSARLSALEEAASDAAARASDAGVASDRTWAFPMYSPGALDGLAQVVAREFQSTV